LIEFIKHLVSEPVNNVEDLYNQDWLKSKEQRQKDQEEREIEHKKWLIE
jgi:hypothetical protein